MPLSLDLAYHNGTIRWDFKQTPVILKRADPEPVIDVPLFQQRLVERLRSERLDLRKPAVVVADRTRLCEYQHYLPVLLDHLVASGASPEHITLFIAYGTHPSQSIEACRRIYGPVFDAHRWVHHRCDDAGAFVELGRTHRGTPVRMRKDIMAATCLITIGAISHHYFAGFGGGRKLIFPGLGEQRAIYHNHSLFLDRIGRQLATACQPGVLTGNPLAEDLAEVETFRPADIAIHGILDSHGRVCDLLVGQGGDHFLAACEQHQRNAAIEGHPYDLVLASCGGFPKDINLIQSHKAIHHAAAFVRDGGRLILLAGCSDGVGSETFLPWFDMGGWHAAFDRLADRYAGNGGTALAMMEKVRRIDISLVSGLAPEVADKIGVTLICVDAAKKIVSDHQGSLAVVPNASVLVRKSDI